MGYPAGWYPIDRSMPDQEPNHGVTRSCVVICCVELKAGDLVEFRCQPVYDENSRHTIKGCFLGQHTDGGIIVSDLATQRIRHLYRGRIIDARIVSKVSDSQE